MAPSRRRVLFIAEAVTLAHVARANVLARALDPERFEVHAAWDPRYNRLLGDLPFRFHPHFFAFFRDVPVASLEGRAHARRRDVTVVRAGRPVRHRANGSRRDCRGLPALPRRQCAARQGAAHRDRERLLESVWAADVSVSPLRLPGREHRWRFSIARLLFRMFRKVGFAAHTRPLNRVLREQGLPGNRLRPPRDVHVRGLHRLRGRARAGSDVEPPGASSLHRTGGMVAGRATTSLVGRAARGPPGGLRDARELWGGWHTLPTGLEGLADLPVTVIAATAGRVALATIPANAQSGDFPAGSEAARSGIARWSAMAGVRRRIRHWRPAFPCLG